MAGLCAARYAHAIHNRVLFADVLGQQLRYALIRLPFMAALAEGFVVWACAAPLQQQLLLSDDAALGDGGFLEGALSAAAGRRAVCSLFGLTDDGKLLGKMYVRARVVGAAANRRCDSVLLFAGRGVSGGPAPAPAVRDPFVWRPCCPRWPAFGVGRKPRAGKTRAHTCAHTHAHAVLGAGCCTAARPACSCTGRVVEICGRWGQ